MSEIFPEPITNLPEADIPLNGVKGYLSQGQDHQVLFWEFIKETQVPEHAHKAQWGVVLEGKIDLVIDGIEHTYSKGDRYFIPEGAKHSAKVYAGYADITFFNEPNRYKARHK